MNCITKKIYILLIFSILGMNSFAQYGSQVANRGFEEWTTREVFEQYSVSEPVHWHSNGTASGTYSDMLPSGQLEQAGHPRPGSSGTNCVRLKPKKVLFVTANGNLTNGRMNAGSMSASGSDNYNYTQRSESAFNSPISVVPDSLTVWVCFRSESSNDRAQVKADIHGDADYRLTATGEGSPANMHVATALTQFTRTSTAGGAYTWHRMSVPFVNNGPCTDPRYVLFAITTNTSPGSGSTSDDLLIDDILFVYNPTLSLANLTQTQFAPGSAITIPFTLTGTMSPDNLNATANVVIAQLSDANGSFSNPTELGRVTTNTSGSISAQLPNVANGQYRIRVISTNYPMIGQNIQQVNIAIPTYAIAATANPTAGGTVSGAGEYQQGSSCTLTATANTGYTFTNWTENGTEVSTNASYSFTVNGNRNLVANFTLNTYTVSVAANPTAGGTVTGGDTYTHGQNCTVTATAATGYTFTNWTENGTEVSTNASYSFTVEGNRNLVANFTAITYTITLSANPGNSGTTLGGGTYNHGQFCTVIATSANGYTFVNWTENGSVVSSDANYSFTVTSNRSLVANFEEQLADTYNINVSPNPSIGGTVTGGGSYEGDQQCTVTATANTGYTFINWTEDGEEVTTDASYTFTVVGNRNLVANFTLNSYMISASADPSEGGTIYGEGEYDYGTECTLTATANESYIFVEWTRNGESVSTNETYTFTVTDTEAYVAHFQLQTAVREITANCQIFPNPFAAKVSVKSDKTIKGISVYDLFGRLVRAQRIADTHFILDLNDLNDGTYMLQLDYGDGISTHRIVKAAQ